MRTLVAGVDCSTQSTKVVVVDADKGETVGVGRAEHSVEGSEGVRETHPDVWWQALISALRQTNLAGEVAAISVAGQQHGLVCLDESGKPLRPAMLWNDTRAAPDAANLVDAFGGATRWAARVGVVPVASFTASKWAWLRRNEPAIADRTAAIRLPHDFLTGRLCGAGVTDRGDASGTAWWSSKTEAYDPEVLALPAIGLTADRLPRVLGPTEQAGVVTAAAAAESGLPEGAIVGPGTGDNMGAALGLGLRPGVPVLSLGTSGTVFLVSETRTADPTGDVAGFADATGRFLPLACTLNCTLAIDRVAAWLHLDRENVAPSGGVVMLPYLDGERTPNLPDASGAVFGLRHTTDPRAILMAAYEGAIVGLLDALGAIDACSSGVNPDAPLILVGGGANGETWQRVAQRLSGRPIEVPHIRDVVGMGAAVQAAAVLRHEEPADVAARWGTASGVLLPAVPRDTETMALHRSLRVLASAAVQTRRPRP
jgi:xylulokinase